MEDFDSIQRNFRFKPDEIFPRIKISLLVALICETAYFEAPPAEPETEKQEEKPATAKSTMESYRSPANRYTKQMKKIENLKGKC